MNCKKIRVLLSALLDDELTAGEKELANEHLKTCPACRERLEGTERARKLFSFGGKLEPPPFFETGVLSRISERAPVASTVAEFMNMGRKAVSISFGILFIIAGIFIARTFLVDARDSYRTIENYLFRDNLTVAEKRILMEPEVSQDNLLALTVYSEEVR